MTAPALDKESELVALDEARDGAESALVAASVRRVYRLAEETIRTVGGMDVLAGICGIDRGDLRRSLDRKNRYLAVDHVIAIGARVRRYNATLATQLGAAIVQPFDLLVFPRVTLTAEQKAERLERLVRSMPLGDQLVAAALGDP